MGKNQGTPEAPNPSDLLDLSVRNGESVFHFGLPGKDDLNKVFYSK
jgi:hypothetical protein